jgi:hypothetical protein
VLIIVAILPLKASVTLAAILTAALAFLTFRQAADFVLVTVLAIAMLWRGEAWKTVFLQSEQRVSELEQRLRQPSASSAISSYLAQNYLCADARCDSPTGVSQFHGLLTQDALGIYQPAVDLSASEVFQTRPCTLRLNPLALHHAAYASQSCQLSAKSPSGSASAVSLAGGRSNFHTQDRATPAGFT